MYFNCISMYFNCISLYFNVFQCISMYFNVFQCTSIVFHYISTYFNCTSIYFNCTSMYFNILQYTSIIYGIRHFSIEAHSFSADESQLNFSRCALPLAINSFRKFGSDDILCIASAIASTSNGFT